MRKKGFTLIEIMIALIILVLLVTALWRVFSATNKNAQEVMQNTVLNDELDRTLLKIMDDVREANSVATWPKLLDNEQLETFNTDNQDNKLEFIKVTYDFTIPPSSPERNYTSVQITYRLDKDEGDPPKYILIREMRSINTDGQAVDNAESAVTVLEGLEECLFYRLKDPDSTRTSNIYIKIKKGRTDKEADDDMKYSSESLISVKTRGSMPDHD